MIALVSGALSWLFAVPTASTARAQASPIQHIVVLYLENHSFDNIFGYWCNNRPQRCLLNGVPSGMPASVKLSNGQVVAPGTTPDLVPNVDHSVYGQELAMDGGKMDGWGQHRHEGSKPGHLTWALPGCGPAEEATARQAPAAREEAKSA